MLTARGNLIVLELLTLGFFSRSQEGKMDETLRMGNSKKLVVVGS